MIGGMSTAAKTERGPTSGYETPKWLVERIRAALGGEIHLDPCTTKENPTGASRFFAPPEQDGILCTWWWAKTIYINPPYGRTIAHWTDKAIDMLATECKVILLVPARTDAAWFQRLAKAASGVVFHAGRIQFVTGGKPNDAPFPSAIVGINHDLSELADLGWRITQK
jgi:phage N-6-adenine-methyltransferase